MGYGLKRENESWHINTSGWLRLLDLARAFGWKAAGTLPPDEWAATTGCSPDEWENEDYELGFGQRVTAEDACALADALERALPSVASGNLPYEFERGYVERLKKHIKFLRRGGFEIAH